jgi:hypothetical protein
MSSFPMAGWLDMRGEIQLSLGPSSTTAPTLERLLVPQYPLWRVWYSPRI